MPDQIEENDASKDDTGGNDMGDDTDPYEGRPVTYTMRIARIYRCQPCCLILSYDRHNRPDRPDH